MFLMGQGTADDLGIGHDNVAGRGMNGSRNQCGKNQWPCVVLGYPRRL